MTWFLAIRHLFSRKRQTFLIFLGIMLGTVTYIFIAGMQVGFQEFIIRQLVENDGHLKISAREELIERNVVETNLFTNAERELSKVIWPIPPFGKRDSRFIENPGQWIHRLEKHPEVKAVSPQISLQVIATHGGQSVSAQLSGIIPEKHMQVTRIADSMEQGSLMAVGNTGNRAIVGSVLAKNLGLRVGQNVLIMANNSKPRPFKVVGIFKFGVQQIDDRFIYASLTDVQSLAKAQGRITTLATRLFNVEDSTLVADQLKVFGTDKVQSWQEANASFLHIFVIQDLFRIFITAGILLVASFGIYNVLSIIVNQKKREIAILRALGYPPNDILRLFVIQGAILGTSGAAVGLGVGYLICLYMSTVRIEGMGQNLTISFAPSIYVTGFFMSLISSLAAGLLPARAAAKFTPVEIIRQEG